MLSIFVVYVLRSHVLFSILSSPGLEYKVYWKATSKFSHNLKKLEVYLLESDHRELYLKFIPTLCTNRHSTPLGA